jgi:hypothetical protein
MHRVLMVRTHPNQPAAAFPRAPWDDAIMQTERQLGSLQVFLEG